MPHLNLRNLSKPEQSHEIVDFVGSNRSADLLGHPCERRDLKGNKILFFRKNTLFNRTAQACGLFEAQERRAAKTLNEAGFDIDPTKDSSSREASIHKEAAKVQDNRNTHVIDERHAKYSKGEFIYDNKVRRLTRELDDKSVVAKSLPRKNQDSDREIAIHRELSEHTSSVIKYLGVGIEDDKQLLLMEDCPAGDLEHVIGKLAKHQCRLAAQFAGDIKMGNKGAARTAQAAMLELKRLLAYYVIRALARIHERGYVHIDVKPQNFLLGPDGRLKAMDFGTTVPAGTVLHKIPDQPRYASRELMQFSKAVTKAKKKRNRREKELLKEAGGAATRLTKSEKTRIKATALQEHPEPELTANSSTDIYSAHTVISQIFNGTMAFDAEWDQEVEELVMENKRTKPKYGRAEDAHVQDLLDLMSNIDPDSRPSAVELLGHPLFAGLDDPVKRKRIRHELVKAVAK